MKDFAKASDQRLITFGQCQHLAGVVDNHPSIAVMGLEHTEDESRIDIILGLDGHQSSPDRMMRVGVDDFISMHGWCQVRAQPLIKRTSDLLKNVSALLNPVMPIVYAHGALQSGSYSLS